MKRIEDYAMIGDCRTAALIGRNGSLDWLCLPRFDSPACFAALLGARENGAWKIAPAIKAKAKRAYRDSTMILESIYENKQGRVKVIDFMPISQDGTSIVRLVVGLKGRVKMRTELTIRFDYGRTIPWVNRTSKDTLRATAGENRLVLRTPVPIHGEDMHSVADFTVKAGETIPFVLTYHNVAGKSGFRLNAKRALAATEKFWRGWAGQCTVPRKGKSAVMRSLLTLKALTYQPTGGMVAAATTSLPEFMGGSRNWDYRYCWLRDASFVLLAFLNAGYVQEAKDWQDWLMRVVAGAPSQLQTLYGVGGERLLHEWKVDWLPGFAASAPVRIGNAAMAQRQLDIFGEIANVLAIGNKAGLPDPPRKELRSTFLAFLETIWRKPDDGIWEIRGRARHFVHSKLMAWVAFDRAAKADKKNSAKWRAIADKIHADILAKGIDKKRGCFVQAYGGKEMDAALLMIPVVGFLPASDPRVVRTVAEIEKHLLRNGLVMRYDSGTGVDGLLPGEGAFLACSFWLADNYILMGRLAEARRLFKRLAGLANDVGLLAEEYDSRAKRMLSNFPQAFSHVALINTAINLLHADAK